MVVESLCIIVIILLIAFIFLRDKRYEYARSAMMLLIVPVSYLIAYGLSYPLMPLLDCHQSTILIVGIVIGMVAAAIMQGLTGLSIKKQSLRAAYLIMSGLFILVLGLIFIFYSIWV